LLQVFVRSEIRDDLVHVPTKGQLEGNGPIHIINALPRLPSRFCERALVSDTHCDRFKGSSQRWRLV
jgi:hypothetical protein